MPNSVLKPLAHGLLMGKILASAPAAIPIRLSPYDKPYLFGTIKEIDKSIRATARTITRTSLKDKIKTETVLHKAGLRSLTQCVSEAMACSIWRARNEMNPLGLLFQNSTPKRLTRSSNSKMLCQPIPGHPEAATNKLARVWNIMDLSSAKTLGSAKTLARKWYNQNAALIQ